MIPGLSGATRVYAIVGDPIAQVKSPEGVTAGLRAAGLDAVVMPAHVAPADLATWVGAMGLQRNLDGILVTVPHKFAVLPLCAELTPRAASIGAVNILRRRPDAAGGGWLGDMCDGEGHVAGLRAAGCEPRGLRALLVGAGGAGSAIAHALVDAGVAGLQVFDPDAARCQALLDKLRRYAAPTAAGAGAGAGGGAVPVAAQAGVPVADPQGFDLVVNATPLGMRAGDPLPIALERLQPATFVSDVVTVPAVPPLIAQARASGCPTMTGSAMFTAVAEAIVRYFVSAPPRA